MPRSHLAGAPELHCTTRPSVYRVSHAASWGVRIAAGPPIRPTFQKTGQQTVRAGKFAHHMRHIVPDQYLVTVCMQASRRTCRAASLATPSEGATPQSGRDGGCRHCENLEGPT